MEKRPVGFDKTKLECFNCHNTGHFVGNIQQRGHLMERRRGGSLYQTQEAGKKRRSDGFADIDDGVVNWENILKLKRQSCTYGYLASSIECSKEDSIGKPSYSRFTKTNDFKGVPHPLSGDYTPKPQEEIDDSLYVYGKKGPQKPEISVSDESTSEHSSCQSNDSEGLVTRDYMKKENDMGNAEVIGLLILVMGWQNQRTLDKLHYNSGPTFIRTVNANDIDYLSDSMNYIPVSLENQANPHAGASEVTNSAVPEAKDESRTSSINSKKEETLTEPQKEKKDSSTESLEDNPRFKLLNSFTSKFESILNTDKKLCGSVLALLLKLPMHFVISKRG
ncbi:hypothetical protein Tco_1502314 [Tanacetum coccineum]